MHGDPTEAALIVAAQKAGLARERLSKRLPRIETIPFEPEYRYMATLHGGDSPRLVFDRPVRAVTPGQIAVAYRGKSIAAGGTIVKQ